ncbi:MAG TPA: O-antigen ligase family protein [Gaiellaceae bacterium]|nr:O-antigen ligase family protein [Gaiellaceae bacterium]
MTWRRTTWALHVLVVGLALHNLVMAQLWRWGVRGNALSAVAAWKDVLLVVALVLAWSGRRGAIAFSLVDRLALLFTAFLVVYAVVPQHLLGGGATHKGVLYALRHDLLPVEAYFLGRGLWASGLETSRVCRTIAWTAAGVAAFGLLDVYLVPLTFWRHEAAGWFRDQLGLHYFGLSGLPENFIYNAGNNVIFRRLTSTFLSPLATGYLLVVALLVLPLRARRWAPAVALLVFAALLWTHTRAALIALVLGLLVIALLRRAPFPLALAIVVAVVSVAFVKEYTHFGPRTRFTKQEQIEQEKNARASAPATNDATSARDSSLTEHASSLRAGARTVLHHPWGYGLGNSGVTAERTGVKVKAGESTYTELGVEVGLAGALVFVAWSLALLWRLRRLPWLCAVFAAVLFLGLQTDIIGVPWIAVVVWALAGASAVGPRLLQRDGAESATFA